MSRMVFLSVSFHFSANASGVEACDRVGNWDCIVWFHERQEHFCEEVCLILKNVIGCGEFDQLLEALKLVFE